MRILFVDDDETWQETVHQFLTQAGYDVRCVSNGREALDVLRRDTYRLVITDWEMPQMAGLDLCRAIRAERFAGYVYIIVLTCHSGPEAAVAGLSAGADDFVAKPFHPDELMMRVRVGERILALETRDLAMFALAKLAESRDPETGAHLERVRGYCRSVMVRLDQRGKPGYAMGSDYVETLYLTSPLHDIGKIGIPDSVLLKPGRLSDREFEIMKSHAMIGAEALDAALRRFPDASFLRMARDIAATHHERFDGTGYPCGLIGEAIPLCGRIVALADVYDALTSKRVYKSAFGHEVSKSIIIEETGSHFDPELIEAFTEVEDEFIRVRERLMEAEPAAQAV